MTTWNLNLNSAGKKVVLVIVGIAAITLLLFSATVLFGDGIARNAETKELADLSKSMSPGNPTSYRSSSLIKEKSFREEDLNSALQDAKTAAYLSPRNYILWESVARLRERSGDIAGAERTLKIALDLAPNNAALQWAFGNVLLRQEKFERGFGYIQSAVQRDARYAGPAAAIAWDIFDGDVEKSKKAVGDSSPVKAALASYLSKQKRFDEVIEIWNTIPDKERREQFAKEADAIVFDMIRANEYRNGVRVAAGQAGGSESKPKIGTITNASFESPIEQDKNRGFDWIIEKGQLPKIGIDLEKKKAGKRSLAVVFEGGPKKEFRRVSQKVAVVPGESYEFSVSYLARLNTEETLKWVIRASESKKILGETEAAVAQTNGWESLTISFSVPEDIDGVEVYLAPETCSSSVCPKKGIIWFDEFVLN